MLASKSKNIRNLLLGLFSGISAADRPSLVVNEQHLRLCTKTANSIGVWSSFSSSTSQRWRFGITGPPGLGPIHLAACMGPLASSLEPISKLRAGVDPL